MDLAIGVYHFPEVFDQGKALVLFHLGFENAGETIHVDGVALRKLGRVG